MRTKLLVAMMAAVVAMCASARKPNYDESKIAPYTLEDPLSFADGTRLTSPDHGMTGYDRSWILDFSDRVFTSK